MKYFPINSLPKNGELFYFPNFISEGESSDIFDALVKSSNWRCDKIKMFGKEHEQARKVAWEGEPGVEYTYSNITMVAKGWSEVTKDLKERVEQKFKLEFNSVLINYYRNGKDHMSWHSDNEKELGENPIIASLSFGANRDFIVRHNDSKEKIVFPLGSGDLILMMGEMQNFWKHSLPKRLKVSEGRINLTYRLIV